MQYGWYKQNRCGWLIGLAYRKAPSVAAAPQVGKNQSGGLPIMNYASNGARELSGKKAWIDKINAKALTS
jgi:hypothetical protein